LQDFHHDVTLKRVLMVYLNDIKKHRFIHEKECELVESILRYVHTLCVCTCVCEGFLYEISWAGKIFGKLFSNSSLKVFPVYIA
jgi:hypothetical protein